MRIRSSVLNVIIVVTALLALASCKGEVSQKAEVRPKPSMRILFIGNSYTFASGGIDKQLEGLAPSVETVRLASGGYTLEKHWGDGNALQDIRKGGWNYVVLQEQSQRPVIENEKDKFREFARMFDSEIRANGARTVLLMTWERPDSVRYGVTTANMSTVFNSEGAELGARVAPAGTAFARSLRERPDLVLYSQDGHPNTYGTYLAACVLYGAIFNKSPVGNPYSDKGISPETRAYLQRIAAETMGL